MIKRLAAVLLLGLVVGACASDTPSQYARGGDEYGVTKGVFRGRWWSYYERGASYLSGDYLQEAVSDLQKALEGHSEDSWRARTYGLHFVEYFPNRELGIAYLKLGQVEEAEQYLQRSLEQVDTDRAHYYLDLVKKEKVAKGIITDGSDPGLNTSLTEGAFITSRVVDLQVGAQDDVGVYNLDINGTPVHLRGSQQAISHQQDLVLNEGPQQVNVAATDLADKQVSSTVNVTVDLTGPSIGVFEPADALVTQADSLLLKGAAVDKNGVTRVAVGEEVLYEGDAVPRHEFEKTVSLSAGDNNLIIIARDIAGNETRTAVSVYRGDAASKQAKLWRLNKLAPDGVKMASTTDAISLDMLLAA
ncbi:MAG: hypothetical protein HYZ00_01055, partial [Candidatus Hydrogenedentes bacterium]|nr:hypothetical protein [Candidatus Hydrogenedentota bacterium]